MLGQSRTAITVPYAQIANIEEDKFLFCITFPKFEYNCCCGLSLRSGVLLIGLFFLLCGVSGLYSVIGTKSAFDYYSAISLLSAYGLSFLLLFLSTLTYYFPLAYSAYLLYTLILMINFGEVVLITVLIFIGWYKPLGNESNLVKGISFLFVGFLLTCVFAYFIWIIFSYAIHLKYRRIDLIRGNYNGENMNEQLESNYKEI